MTSVVGGRLGGWQAVQSADAGSRRDHETVCFRGSRARPATRGRVAVGCGIRDGVTWRRKGATVSVIILVLFIAAITTSVIALARSVIRDGHGRRPEVGSYDSRRPTL